MSERSYTSAYDAKGRTVYVVVGNGAKSVGKPLAQCETEQAAIELCAVPDLVSALEQVVDHYVKPSVPWNVPNDSKNWISEARKVLAKIKGELEQ